MRTPIFNLSENWQQDGMLTDSAGNFVSNLVQQLQLNFPDDGHIVPSLTHDNIKKMQVETKADGSRNYAYYQTKLVHDSTNNVLRINDTKGKFLAIQTKLNKKWDATKAWVKDDKTLTQDAIDFLAQLVEEII